MLKVLVVDDCEIDREKICRMLQNDCSLEYCIETATSASSGLTKLSQDSFDCVLLDYRLQDMDGLEFMQQTRAQGVDRAATIILTGTGDPEIDQSASKLGAFDYLVKDRIESELLERSIRYAVSLARQMKELQHANRTKDDFMAAVSHEMRTPLNAVINYCGHLQDGVYGPLDSRHQQIISRVERSGKHLSAIVESILTTTAFARDAVRLDLSQFDLAIELQFCLDLILPLARKKGLQLSSSSPPSLPCIGDANKVRQVLINVLGNAVKFTQEGQIHAAASQCDGECIVEVSDSGIGIAKEDLDRIFEPFTQVDFSLSRRFGGLGLGLTITKQLVELHGGRLQIESQPNQGTTVIIFFPQEGPS